MDINSPSFLAIRKEPVLVNEILLKENTLSETVMKVVLSGRTKY